MKKLILSLLLLLPLVSGPVVAAGDGIHTKVLENGLRIVVKEDHGKPLAALRIYVNTGAALEMEFLGCGISHYYEHLLSGGTTWSRSEEESARILQKLGGQSNAYTRSEHTCYHVVTHRDFIGTAVELYGDWMMNNALSPKEVAREKKVILKEFNMGEDEPSRVIYKLFMDTMFRKHPIRVPTIGYRENFERITHEDLVNYYKNRYAPNNTVVAIAGDVDPAETFAMVEKALGGWEQRPIPVVNLPVEPRQTSPRFAEKEHDVGQTWVRMGYHTIDLFHPDLYALDMVAAVLSNGRSSRLFKRVVEQERLTDGINAWSWTPHFMPGVFGVVFQADAEKVDGVLSATLEEIERMKTELVPEAELTRAKVQVEAYYKLAHQSVEEQATQAGSDFLSTGDPRFSLRYVEGIRKVTPEEVREAARKWLDPNGRTVAMLKPVSKEAATAKTGKETGLEVEVRKVSLENGLTVLLKKVPGAAPVAIESYSLAGLRAEPAGLNGVSNLAGRLLVKGTKTRSATDIARQMEEIGASIGASSGNNSIGLSVTLARGATDLPLGVSILADVLENATYPEAEFAKEKQNALTQAARLNENWQMESYLHMRREIFGDHPYGNPSVGTTESLEGIGREDVLAFVRDHLRPESTVIGVAGNLDLDATEQLFRQAFAGWTVPGEHKAPAPAAPAWQGGSLPEDRFAFKPNQKRQGVISVAFAGPTYENLEDRAALLVVDAFTSGIGLPSGWLHNALRGGERSYVYFVHLSLFPGLEGGVTYITTQTTPEYMEPVYGLLMEQIDRLKKGGFTDEELETGRVMALISGPYYRQTVANIAQSMTLSELYGMGHDWDARFDEALKKVTREDVMRVVNRYFGKKLVTVTGPEAVKEKYDELPR